MVEDDGRGEEEVKERRMKGEEERQMRRIKQRQRKKGEEKGPCS